MAQQKTERMDKAVGDEMMRLLRERVNDPTKAWHTTDRTLSELQQDIEEHAVRLLKSAQYLDTHGWITIPGMDYHRQETKRFRWLRANAFPVFVAVLTAGATLGAGIITIWFGNRPC